MKQASLILLAVAFCLNAQVYTTDMVQPYDGGILHALDTAADGIDTIENNYGLKDTLKAVELIPGVNDSGTLFYNPLGSPPNVWLKRFMRKGQSYGLISRRIKWGGSGLDSCIGYFR